MEFGAEVIRMKGSGAGSGVGAAHAATKMGSKTANDARKLIFIYLKFWAKE